MKKRRTVLIAFLLMAVMVIGVGYAATSAELLINGTAATTASDIDVYFSAAALDNSSTADAKAASSAGSIAAGEKRQALTFSVKQLKRQSEFVKANYTITNDSSYDVSIPVPTITKSGTGAGYFDISTDWGNETKTVKAGETVSFSVTVTLNTTIIAEQDCGFDIKFTATALETRN